MFWWWGWLCEEAGGLVAAEFCLDGCVKIVEEVLLLLLAGCNRGPHAFVVALSRFAPCPLCDLAINDTVPNLLFAVVVCWLNAIGKHEAKIVL